MKILRIIIDPTFSKRLLSARYGVFPPHMQYELLDTISEISDVYFREKIQSSNSSDFTTDYLPIKEDGYQYSMDEYLYVVEGNVVPHQPDIMDYTAFIKKFDLINRKNAGEFDEVHVWGGPYMGFYESRMVGNQAIWCNSPAYPAQCGNFIIMGFSYERGLAEALESFGHRTESILRYVYPTMFRMYERCVGTIHTPFNGDKDYDWSNPAVTDCWADTFPMYPFSGAKFQKASCDLWGGDHLGYMKWWFSKLPKYTWGINLRPENIVKRSWWKR